MKVAILAATAAALLLPTAAHAQQTVKPPTTTVKPANKNHSSFTIRRRNITYNQPIASTLFANSATLTKRISLDVTDSPVRDALKMVAMKANQELVIDNDVPQDTRITVRATMFSLTPPWT